MRFLSGDAVIALGAAFAWALTAAIRVGNAAPLFATFIVALGGSAVWLVPALVVVRAARPVPSGLRTLLVALGLAAAPIAALAAVLAAKTHHRALGGVTFAAGAFTIVAFAWLVAARLLSLAGQGDRRAAGARAFLALLGLLSFAGTAALVAVALPAGGAPALFDSALGGALFVMGALASRVRPPVWAGVTALAALALVIAASRPLSRSSPRTLELLVERAPLVGLGASHAAPSGRP